GQRSLLWAPARAPARVDPPAGVGAWHGQTARCGAGGQQQLRVAKTAAVGEPHLALRRIDPGDPGAEAQFDVVLGVPGPRVDVDRLPVGLAQQVVLGYRRALAG